MKQNNVLEWMQYDTEKMIANNTWVRSSKGTDSRAYKMHEALAKAFVYSGSYELEVPTNAIRKSHELDILLDGKIAMPVKYPHGSMGKNIGNYIPGYIKEALELLQLNEISDVVILNLMNKYILSGEDGQIMLNRINPLDYIRGLLPDYADKIHCISILGWNNSKENTPSYLVTTTEINNETLERRLFKTTATNT